VNRSPSTVSGSRFEILDWLRGLSALSVVVYHAVMHWGSHLRRLPHAELSTVSFRDWLLYACHCGHLGVPLFFMISGYCISAAADKHRAAQHSIRRYAWRRYYRIYPSYWIALGVIGLAAAVGASNAVHWDLTPSQWLGNLTLIEEWRPWLLGPSEKKYFLPVAWTLCYEEQFYFLVGVLLFVCPRWLFPCLALLTAFVVGNSYNLNIGPLRQLDLNRYQTDLTGLVCDSRWLLFAAGIGVYLFVTLRTSAGWRRALRWTIPLLLASLTMWELRQGDWDSNRFQTRVLTFSVALVLCGAQRFDRVLSGWRGAAPLRWLGDRTYSIYLIHYPAVMAVTGIESALGVHSPMFTLCVTVPLALVVSVVAGALFYQLVERRFVEGLLRSRGSVEEAQAAP